MAGHKPARTSPMTGTRVPRYHSHPTTRKGFNLTILKTTLFTQLIQDIKQNPLVPEKYRPTAIEAINQIMRSIRQPPNYDRTNGMFADDVLYLVCIKIDKTKNVDALIYLSEQLSDIMTSGQCSQGRSTRIFQVLFGLETLTPHNEQNTRKLKDSKD